MPRATIDLSWLPGLLTPTPQATPNDLYGADQEQPYTDPVTGQTSSNPAYTDKSGQEIPGSVAGKDTQSFFNRPTKAQELFKPEQSQYIDRLNSEFVARPALAQLDDATKIGLATGHLQELGPNYLYPGLDARRTAIAGGGQFSSPTDTLNQETAAYGIENGLPAIRDTAAHNEAVAATEEAAARARQAAMGNSLNNPENAANVTSLGLKYQAGDYAGRTALQPMEFGNTRLSLENQRAQDLGLAERIPSLNTQALNEAKLGADLSGTKLQYEPQYQRTIGNDAVSGMVTSSQIPEGPLFVNSINPSDNSITTRSRNPYGMPPFMQTMAGMSELGANGSQTVTDNKGKTYAIPSAGRTQTIDPMSSLPINPSRDNTTSNGSRPLVSAPLNLEPDPNSPGMLRQKDTTDYSVLNARKAQLTNKYRSGTPLSPSEFQELTELNSNPKVQ